LSYRGNFAEPGPAYTLADGLPFTEGEMEVCDRRYVNKTPAITAAWTRFQHRFFLFERSEYKDSQTDGVTITERGHIKSVTHLDPALFGIPSGFKGDCTVAPRPGNCAKLAVATAIFAAEYPLRDYAYKMAAGSHNDVWFLEPEKNLVGTLSAGGVLREFKVPTSSSQFQAITLGPDGAVWFLDCVGKIGRVDANGQIKEFGVGAN